MAERIPARLTAAEGRKFGFTVGLAFLAIAGLLYWRHHTMRAYAVAPLGVLLILGALAVPTMLGPIQRAWMGLAHLISKVTTPIFMGVVYFLVITPIGFIRRISGASGINRPAAPGSRWTDHTPPRAVRESMERQF